jgi:hypothetical protein
MSDLLSKNRTAVYLVLNAAFILLIMLTSISHGASFGTLLYVSWLFILCTLPVMFLDGFNGRYALLGIFLAVYFMFFGALDTVNLLFGGAPASGDQPLSEAELALLCGAAATLLGYRGGLAVAGPGTQPRTVADWAPSTVLIFGTTIWMLGTAAIVFFQVFAVPEKTDAAAQHGFALLGPTWTFVVMLGHMIEPLGLVIIAYGYARQRTFNWLLLALVTVLVQIAVGFIADIKSLAMLAGILVILARTLVDNKLPKAWLIGGGIFIVFAFPLFQAYRADVSGARGLNHVQALQNIDKVLEIVLENRDKVTEGRADERSQTFIERASLKANVELAFQHTGIDVPFQRGDTLVGLLVAFIPRLIWADKPDVPVGQLFNKEFIRTGEKDTYISPSHFGELYWNFGWPGILVGMAFIGGLLGFTAARCNLAEGKSVTRMLVLLTTVRYVCLGFEGSIAVAYIIWLRSLGAIALLHLFLARQAPETSAAVDSQANDPQANPERIQLRAGAARFPNLMR